MIYLNSSDKETVQNVSVHTRQTKYVEDEFFGICIDIETQRTVIEII